MTQEERRALSFAVHVARVHLGGPCDCAERAGREEQGFENDNARFDYDELTPPRPAKVPKPGTAERKLIDRARSSNPERFQRLFLSCAVGSTVSRMAQAANVVVTLEKLAAR